MEERVADRPFSTSMYGWGKRVHTVTFFHDSSKMCSRNEPGRPGNVDTPQQGPFQIGTLDFYVYRWAYTSDSDLEELNKVLMTCFAESNHTPTELLDTKDSSEAEDSHIVIGVPHGIADPLSDIHVFAVVTSYDTDVKQDITASWHIS